MATGQLSEVIQHLRRAMLLREGAGLTDGQLLEDYLSRRDETALAALVQRHGPMVWGVCRRVLSNYHDAEDAFQATFLVLVRKAAAIASPELLANWLYGVAHQTAIKARATVAKRKTRERQVTEMPEPAVIEQDPWKDLQPLLDQELSRLPDIARVVLVLCDLEGKTRKEAARHLGLPEGTVASRLARARGLLAKRLAQRGVVLSGGALAAALARNVASAGVPDSVVSSTLRAASVFAAGKVAATGAISVKVVALTEGVLRAMMMNKLKAVVAVVLVLSVLVTGATILACRTAGAQSDKPPTVEEREVKADDADARALPTGAIARLGSPRLRHGARLKDIAYSPNGKRLASVGYDNTLRAWDAESGQPLFAVTRPDGGFDKVSFAAEGTVIVALGRDADKRGVLWRIEAATGKVLDRLKLEAALPKSTMPEAAAVRFSADGSRLALGSVDKKQLLVIDTSSAKVIWTADLGKEVPGGVTFASDGKTVAVATSAGRVHLFDRDGKPTAQFKTEGNAELSSVALSPDGKLVVALNSGTPTLELITWDRATGRILWTQERKGGHGVAFTSDSTTIVECGGWSFASTIDAANGKAPGNDDKKDAIFESMAEVRCLALHPGGKIVAFGTDSGTMCLFDVATHKPVAPTAEPSRFVERLRFSADGKTLYGWALDWLAWDVATGKQRYVTNEGGWHFTRPLSPDGKYTIRRGWTGGLAGRTRLDVCDAATGKAVHSFTKDFEDGFTGADFTPDGKAIIVCQADRSFEIWSLEGETLAKMSGHKGQPVYRAFSASAQVMVTATVNDPPEEFSVRVWDLKNGKELAKFKHGVGLMGNGYAYGSLVALSGDGRRVAALTYANSYGKPEPKEHATVWDVASGKVLATVPQGGDSGCIALSPDGRMVAVSALWKSDVWVYEVAGGGERFHFRHGGEVTGLAFAPDGRTLAAASKEAPVYLWDVSGKLAEPVPPAVPEKQTPPKQEPEREKEGFTAWGKEAGGLQAGLGFRPGEHRVYHHGETVTLVVRIRNVGKETVKFEYIRQFLDENPPTVTDADGKTVPQLAFDVLGGHPPVEVSLEPGKETELESRMAGGAKLAGAPFLRYGVMGLSGGGTGKFGLQYERVLGNSSAGSIKLDPTLSKLGTGKLELEIKSEPPPTTEKK